MLAVFRPLATSRILPHFSQMLWLLLEALLQAQVNRSRLHRLADFHSACELQLLLMLKKW